MHDVGGDVGEEVVVVADHQRGGVGEGAEVPGEPLHRVDVQVVRGFVEQEEVGFLQHGSRDGEPHAPPPGQLAHHLLGDHLRREPDSFQTRFYVRRVRVQRRRLRRHEREDGLLQGHEHLVLHEDAPDVLGEPVDVPGREAGQQRGLTRAVLPHHPVPPTALQFQRRRPEQHLSREREDDPFEVEAVSLRGRLRSRPVAPRVRV